MAKATSSRELFRKVLIQGAVLTAAVAILGAIFGWIFDGEAGLASAFIGAGMTLVFSSLTVLSVWFGGRLSLGGFFGVVLGGWILKMIIFIGIVAALKGADYVSGPVLFFALVASILGTLTLEALAVLRSRIPTVGN